MKKPQPVLHDSDTQEVLIRLMSVGWLGEIAPRTHNFDLIMDATILRKSESKTKY